METSARASKHLGADETTVGDETEQQMQHVRRTFERKPLGRRPRRAVGRIAGQFGRESTNLLPPLPSYEKHGREQGQKKLICIRRAVDSRVSEWRCLHPEVEY